MKKYAMCAMVALTMMGCAKHTLVKGEIEDMAANDSVVMMIGDKLDTIPAPQGVFTYEYKGTDAAALHVYPYTEEMRKSGRPYFLNPPARLCIVPGTTVKLSGSWRTYRVEGNAFYDEMNALMEGISEKDAELARMYKELSVPNKGAEMEELRKEYKTLSKNVYEEKLALQKQYIAEHPASMVALYLLYQNRYPEGEQWMNECAEDIKTGVTKTMYAELKEYYDEKAALREAAERVKEGAKAADFTLKDIHGNDFTLSSLKGKYVVLDFWGSWCGWCIKGMPAMKEMYAKYSDRLEIVGIDCNDTPEKWKDAVEKHELPWIHVADPREVAQSVRIRYNVKAYPTKIILSPEGTILKIIVGEKPTFYTDIDEMMQQ